MNIKLIACDLDGTLLGEDLALSPRLREAVRRAQAQGIQATLATGRAYPAALRFCRELSLTAPLICYQGAQVRAPDGAMLHETTLSRRYLPEVIALSQDQGWELAVYAGDEIYQTTQLYSDDYYARWFSLPLHRVDDLLAALPAAPVKFIAIAPDQTTADQIERELGGLAAGRYQVTRSHAWFVEGLGQGVSKGDALARVAAQLGLRREEVMAIGDSGNDRAMVEWAGLGVAMGNASPDVVAVANVVAPSLAEDGAAWAIERFALNRETL
jgi:Cof subfamily protein (haloacid dehalogenase superfamily)